MRRNARSCVGLGVWPLFLLFLPILGGCLVHKGRYDQAREEITSCQYRLHEVQTSNESLRRDMAALRERGAVLEGENRNLLEEMAALGAEYEELARKNAVYRKRAEELEERPLREADTYRTLLVRLSPEIDQGSIRIDQTDTRLKLNLVDKILFASGSAELTEKGKRVLDKVGYALKETRDRRIMIEGHTDDQPLSAALRKQFESNWDLSARRATAVVHYLEEKVGIDPRLLSATGYSKYAPIVQNDSPENRSLNRRIDIVLVPLTPQEMQRLYAVPQEPLTTVPWPASDPPPPPPAAIPVLP